MFTAAATAFAAINALTKGARDLVQEVRTVTDAKGRVMKIATHVGGLTEEEEAEQEAAASRAEVRAAELQSPRLSPPYRPILLLAGADGAPHGNHHRRRVPTGVEQVGGHRRRENPRGRQRDLTISAAGA
jgi:hypothetical protein